MAFSSLLSIPILNPIPTPCSLINDREGRLRSQQVACLEAIRLLHSVLSPPLLDDRLMFAGLSLIKSHCLLAAELVQTGKETPLCTLVLGRSHHPAMDNENPGDCNHTYS